MKLLLSHKIFSHILKLAQIKLGEFVANYQLMYGQEYMTYNVHIALHLVESVYIIAVLYGPLVLLTTKMN